MTCILDSVYCPLYGTVNIGLLLQVTYIISIIWPYMQYCGIAYLSKCYIIILLEWNKDRQNSMHNTGFHKQDQNMDNSHVTVNNRLPMSVNANATDDFRHFRPIKQHADCCHIWLAKCYFLYVFYRLRFRWNLCWVISHLAKPWSPTRRIRSIYTASFAKQIARRWRHNQYRFITIRIAALPHVQMPDAASMQICYRLFIYALCSPMTLS